MKIGFIIVTLVLSGCATGSLKRDYNRSPLDSNHHSALIKTASGFQYGVAVERAELNRPFSFSVQGIHEGSIHVSSALCNFNESRHYTNSEEVTFTPVLTQERCLFGITIMPQFTSEESDGVDWRGVSGVLMVRRSYRGMKMLGVQEKSNRRIFLNLDIHKPARLVLMGCGLKMDQLVQSLPTIELGHSWGVNGDCIIEGFLQSQDETLPFVAYISRYAPQFAKLPFPKIKFETHAIEVNSDSSTSLISFQGVSSFTRSTDFSYDPASNRILTTYTSKGRTAYCDIDGFGNIRCWN